MVGGGSGGTCELFIRVSEHAEDSQDAAVICGRHGQVEFSENPVDVGFDGLGGEEEVLADSLVGAALCHQCEDVAFTFGQFGERVERAAAAQETAHDLGVDR